MANGDDPNKINDSTAATEKNTKATEENTRAKKDNKKANEELLDKLIEERNAKKALSDLEEEAYLRSQAQFKLDEDIEELGMRRIDAVRQLEELRQKQIDNQKRGLPLLKEEAEQLKKLNEVLGEEEQRYLAVKKRVEEVQKAKQGLKSATEALTGVQLDSIFTVKGLTDGMLSMATSLDKASVGLAKTTGYTKAFRGDMIRLAQASDGLFTTLADAQEATGGLTTQFTLFAAQGETTRNLVSDTTMLFKKQQVAVEDTAQAFDLLTRGMGFSVESANRALHTFERLSQEVGLTTGQLVKDFNQLAPEIARFGQRADEVFRNLQRRARELGLTTNQVFQFSEMADTFEGASDLAGKLNAQFGMQLNSMELMRAEGVERVDLLRKEFQARGMNFEQLHKRQKQMIAEIMGTDVQTASRLFGDPVELQKYQREQLTAQERAEKMITLQDKFASLVENIFMMLEKPLTVVLDIFTALAETINGSRGASVVAGVLILKTAFSAAISVIRGFAAFPMMINRSTMAMNALAAATNRAAAANARLNMGGGMGGMGGMGGFGGGGGAGPRGGFRGGGKGLLFGGALAGLAGLAGKAGKAIGRTGLGKAGGRAVRKVTGGKGLSGFMSGGRKLLRESTTDMQKYKQLRAAGKTAQEARLLAQVGKTGGARFAAGAARGALAGARTTGPLGAAMEFGIYKAMGMDTSEALMRTALTFGGSILGGAAGGALATATGGTGALAIPGLSIAGGLGASMLGDQIFGDAFEGAAAGDSGIKAKPLMTQDGGRMEIAKPQGVPVIPGVKTNDMLVRDLKRIVHTGVKEGMGEAGAAGSKKAMVTVPVTIDLGPKLGGKFTHEVRKEIDLALNAL